jgi:hypothetical protein
MADITNQLQAAAGATVGPDIDPNFNQTVLLLHGDGTNGAQNNTFLDGSTNNFTITRNGNTTQGTFSPFSVGAGEFSNFFDGTGDYLSSPNDSAIHVLGSNFCLEGWFYLTAAQGNYGLYSTYGENPTVGYLVRLDTTFFRFFYATGGSGTAIDRTFSFTRGQWYHFAVTNSGGTGRIFINGVQQGSTFTITSPTNSTTALQIGRTHTITNDFPGYFSNFRVVKGSAVYTSDFTPSGPLTAITNTSLLTCQSNRFVDNSTNAFAITRNGDVRVTPFSPFAPSAAYDPAVNGGSGYFVSASGNYLSAGTSTTLALGAGDFCIECWIYITAYNSNTSIIFDYRTSGGSPSNIPALALQTNGQPSFYFQIASPVMNGSKVVPLNAWTHLAVVRNGTATNNCTMYMNGESIATATNTSNLGIQTLAINNPQTGINANQVGWFADFRIVKGSPVYTGAFTPPTAPLTAITNTSLLLNFTNAGIFDNTGKNNLETVGNAQIDTTTKKFGTGSMEFDGTGDQLTIAPTQDLVLGSGNYTIELWVNIGSFTTYGTFVTTYNNATTAGAWFLRINNTTQQWQWQNGANGTAPNFKAYNSSTNLTSGTWYHLAVVRSSGVVTLYQDGVSVGGGADVETLVAPNLTIGRSVNGYELNGYIDDLRITKGVARYTANFTAPTKAFPDQ